MKRIFLSLLLITSFVIAKPQPAEKKAKVILDEVSAKIKASTTIKIEFTYKMENKTAKINDTKNGTMFIKGNKYRIEMASYIIISDGKTVWTYNKDINEVQINNEKNDDNAVNPAKLLNNYSVNFKAKLIKEVTENNKNIQIIDLVPLKTKSFFKVTVKIDKATKQVASSSIFEKKGGTGTYNVNKYQVNVPLNDNLFIFNKDQFKGVEVNDMR